jgi:hypothetical protein
MRHTSKVAAAISSCFLLATLAAVPAQSAEPQRCSSISEDVARLACYDAVFGTPAKSAVAAPTAAPTAAAAGVAVTGAGAASAAVPSKEDQFGLPPEQTRKKVEEPEVVTGPESIDSVLAKLTKRPTGEFIYTLENGQRWVQVEADPAGMLDPGAAVTIKKAALGSFRLVSGPVATRVRRTQ